MRITPELRKRCNMYSSMAISNFVALPKNREEVRIVGRPLTRSGTSVESEELIAIFNTIVHQLRSNLNS